MIHDVFLIPVQVLYIKKMHKDMIGRKQNEMVSFFILYVLFLIFLEFLMNQL